MARKTKKRKVSPPAGVSRWWGELGQDRRRNACRRAAWVAVAVVLAGGVVLGMKALERRVLSTPRGGTPVAIRVRLTERPEWMPVTLARRIAESLAPPGADYNDPSLTSAVYRLGGVCPWIRRVDRVHKRPTSDPRVAVVEVTASFRKPVARILIEHEYVYVDRDGVRLPAGEVPHWVAAVPGRGDGAGRQVCYIHRDEVPPRFEVKSIHYIVIDGVAGQVPPAGQRWEGDDLAAGLQLIGLVSTRRYANQITVVDVRNHAGRINGNEPHLRMYAQVGRGRPTDIRFGQFPVPGGGDYVVSPERKLRHLDDYVSDHDGLLAGLNSYLDLRYDQLHVSLN